MFSQKPQNHLFQTSWEKLRNNHWFASTHMTKIQQKIPFTFIVLDGDYLFDPFMDYGCYWMIYLKPIVIGINQRNNRMEDCRYNKDNGLPSEKRCFFEFIGGELLPYIEKNTVPHRLE
jgi:hypothetical protein